MNGGLIFKSALYAKLLRTGSRRWINLGLLSTRCVTNVGVNWLAGGGAFASLTTHKTGTVDTPESTGDTRLASELLAPPVIAGETSGGTVIVGSSPNIVKCSGVITYAGTYDIVEHGIYSGTVLWDRSTLGKVTAHCGDKLLWVYELTINSGG